MSAPITPRAEGFSFWQLLVLATRRRRLILGLSLGLGVLAGVTSLLSRREYVAMASFSPSESASPAAGLGQLAAQFGLAAPVAASGTPTFYAELLQTKEVAKQVVTTPFAVPGFTGTLVSYFELPDSTESSVRKAVMGLRTITAVRTDRTTGVVSIEVRTRIPELSAAVASRYLDLLNAFNLGRRRAQALAEEEFVNQQTSEAQRGLDEADAQLTAFYRRNRSWQGSPDLAAEEGRLQRQVAFRQQLVLTLAQSRERARIDAVRNTPVVTVIERPETLVTPRPRGTVAKAMLAAVAGALLGLALALLLDRLAMMARSGSPEYEEILMMWRRMTPWRAGGSG